MIGKGVGGGQAFCPWLDGLYLVVIKDALGATEQGRWLSYPKYWQVEFDCS
jgi:hypothetical protein